MRGLWKFGGVIVTLVMIVLMVAALFTAITWRFGLVSIKPTLFYFAFGLILVIGGAFLKVYGQIGGKFFAIAGAILLGIGMYKAVWPNTSVATNNAQEVADVQAALALNSTVAPIAVRCDRESKTMYWDQVTGLAIVHYSLNLETRRIECADRKGFNPFTGVEYKPVTKEIVKVIKQQDPPPVPVVSVVPVPMPVPVLLPVPVAPVAREPVALIQSVQEPVAEPVRAQLQEYSTRPGETMTVLIGEPMDLSEIKVNDVFYGSLRYDISDRDGVLLARSGTPVGMVITRLNYDEQTRTAHLEMDATMLTTTGGTSLPVRTRHDGPIRIRSAQKRRSLWRNRNESMTRGQFILPTGQLRLTFAEPWIVPASVLAAGR